jgi:hypothetical protein
LYKQATDLFLRYLIISSERQRKANLVQQERRHTIQVRVISCGSENWSLILKEEHRPRASDDRVLRRIFGSKSGEVTGR